MGSLKLNPNVDKMPAIAVIGMRWGDEGKGKVVDALSEKTDAGIRYQGGNNAGHTVVDEYGKKVLHSIPVSIIHGKLGIMSWGMAIDPLSLVMEMDELIKQGVDLNNLKISPLIHLVMPWHITEDRYKHKEGSMQRNTRIGTTGMGIGPCYQDKAGRSEALRMADLLDLNRFVTKLEKIYMSKSAKLKHYPGFPPLEEIRKKYIEAREMILPYLADTQKIVQNLLEKGASILLEGAQGQLLDIDTGTYPYVTSSSTISAAASLYTGIPMRDIVSILGVIKAYDTRVGYGPFPTELGGVISEEWCNDPDVTKELEEKLYPDVSLLEKDEFLQGVALRRIGKEYGAVTKRPRRCGFLDLPLLKYSNKFIHATHLALTKIDVLTKAKRVKVCTAYRGIGSEINVFDFLKLRTQRPEFEEMDGWEAIGNVKSRQDLPAETQRFIEKIERFIGIPINFISTGPERHQYIG